jgi:putative copper resistance protein D
VTPEAGLVASRFVHFAAVLLLFGISLFPFYTWRRDETPPSGVMRASEVLSALALVLAIGSGAVWFALTTNSMAESPNAYLDRDTIHFMVTGTDFGKLWIARGAVSALLLLLALIGFMLRSRALRTVTALLTALLLVSLAGTGHAQSGTGQAKWLQASSDAVHLLTAGAWLGGLIPLAIVARRGSYEQASTALTRFSGMGYAAVAALLATGVLNAWFLVGTIHGLIDSSYGRLLSLKILIFATMVALAGLNRFRLVPRLAGEQGGDRASLSRLRRHILAEQTLGFAVILIVSLLGTMAPPVSGT